MRKVKRPSPLNHLNQLEQRLVSQMIELSYDENTLYTLSLHGLKLLGKHPLLKDTITAIWHHDGSHINIMASNGLIFDAQHELEKFLTEVSDWHFLKINKTTLKKHSKEKSKQRIDICLDNYQGNLFCISFWFESINFNFETLMPFFKDILGVLNLSLAKLMSKKREKLLTTILEKAGDSVEITDEEAVIQYVNPAFENITLYNAHEAMNKTVASLLRSPVEDVHLFEQINQTLKSGNTWKGQIRSRKKDGSYWIAQTIIVPVMDDELGRITRHIAIKQDITEQVHRFNQLKISEERYRNLMNAVSDGIFIHNLQGAFLEVNEAACLSLNYSREELINSYVWDIEVGFSQESLNQLWEDVQKGPVNIEGMHRRKDGTIFPVDVRLAVFNATGEKLVLAIVRDITLQKRSEATIRKLTRALEQSPVLVIITDKTGTIEYVNAKVIEQTGYRKEELIGGNTRILRSGQTPHETYKTMWEQLANGEEWHGELLNKNKSGEHFWVSAIISPIRNENEEITHYLAVMEDVTQKKSYEEMLKHQATFDNLTNLPNRLYAFNKLGRAISKAHINNQKLAVLFLDLDEFKQINDSLGHAIGDLLLKALSERFLSVIRQTDTIARLGGDEFMMILENIMQDTDAESIAKKCREVCSQPFIIESQELRVSTSIGIAIYPHHGKDAKTLMRNADTAMYQSKIRGKNNWTVFQNTMVEEANNHIRIKTELYQALTRNELYICYQPIIDLKENKVVAAEALLRWQNTILGQINPDQIIPLAEETGMIIPLGYWILDKVCTQAKEWQFITSSKIKVAVNISTLQLKQKDFINKVQEILKRTKLSADSLIFEITESAFVDDSKFILSQLNKLSDMGIHFSLDDFGVGYSFLQYIKSYPFKSLKIDRVFIQGVNTNHNELSLINSIITMARNLKLSVIAEGIETAEQLELMRSMNCDMVQGWYFSKPLSGDKFSSCFI
ncbi:TPA: EAL domain-containing protein [Legionella pneumophila]|nr:bifunctional diguanylate cyclase/phosphodiesterase [Legionella pneumophila]